MSNFVSYKWQEQDAVHSMRWWWWCPLCTSSSSLNQESTGSYVAPIGQAILIPRQQVFVLVQAHWIKSLQVVMSLQSDMLFWFRDSKSLLLILSDVCLGEKQQILFSPLPINATSGHLYRFDVIWCIIFYFPYVGISTRKQNWGEVSIQILSSFSALYSDTKV